MYPSLCLTCCCAALGVGTACLHLSLMAVGASQNTTSCGSTCSTGSTNVSPLPGTKMCAPCAQREADTTTSRRDGVVAHDAHYAPASSFAPEHRTAQQVILRSAVDRRQLEFAATLQLEFMRVCRGGGEHSASTARDLTDLQRRRFCCPSLCTEQQDAESGHQSMATGPFAKPPAGTL